MAIIVKDAGFVMCTCCHMVAGKTELGQTPWLVTECINNNFPNVHSVHVGVVKQMSVCQ